MRPVRRTATAGVIVTLKEVSELKRATVELSSLACAHELGEELFGGGHLSWDTASGFVRVSGGARRLIGMLPEERVLPAEIVLARFATDDRTTFRGWIEQVARGEAVSKRVDTVRLAGEGSRAFVISARVVQEVGRPVPLLLTFLQATALPAVRVVA
jgi:hypothetical protein